MPTCETRYFGTADYSEESLIQMIKGPFGFDTETAFVVIQAPEQFPLVYLQSTRTPELCFLALPILAIDQAYSLGLSSDEASALDLSRTPIIGTDVLCLALITTNSDGPTANLLAPIVMNLRTRQAMQCINAAGPYSHQHRLCAESEGVAA